MKQSWRTSESQNIYKYKQRKGTGSLKHGGINSHIGYKQPNPKKRKLEPETHLDCSISKSQQSKLSNKQSRAAKIAKST
jgi:hypothetical protein